MWYAQCVRKWKIRFTNMAMQPETYRIDHGHMADAIIIGH
jgi:hypothetical protein